MLQTSRIFFQAAPLWTTGSPRRHFSKSIWTPDAFIRSAASSLLSDARSSAIQNTIQAAVQKKDGRHYVCVHINLNLHILSHIKKCIFLYYPDFDDQPDMSILLNTMTSATKRAVALKCDDSFSFTRKILRTEEMHFFRP